MLVGLVAVILVSAFQRLLLYEAAYGFTRLRAYTHIFMLWLGVLLLVTAFLEGFGQLRYFALAPFLVCLGFGLTLNIVNVDAFIVRQNLAPPCIKHELDAAYLASLSDDAAPALFEASNRAICRPSLRTWCAGCSPANPANALPKSPTPGSRSLARYRAELLYRQHQGELKYDPLPVCP